jgi:hypothetical protein
MPKNTTIEGMIFHDRCPIEKLPSPLAEFMVRNGLFSSIQGSKISFCGLVTYQGINHFFYPRQTDLELMQEKPFRCSSILMQALLKFAENSATGVENPEDGQTSQGFEKLKLLKLLIQDFKQHGLFKFEEVRTKKNIGKTDWKSTISRSTAFPDRAKTPIYLDVYGKKKSIASNEITKIHAEVLREIFEQYGFIFSSKESLPPTLKQYPASMLSVKSKISLLENEIRNHYADQKTTLFKALIHYLNEHKGNQNSNNIIGVTKFHVAWEQMLYEILPNVIDINSRLPKPVFIDYADKQVVAKKFGMRTDIVIENNAFKTLIVLDAKYYEATSTDNSPGWSDLVKQFFYEKALAEMPDFSGYTFKNGLIFPGEKQIFKTIKMRDQSSGKDLDHQFPPIECIYINPYTVLEKYINQEKYDLKILENQ